MINDSRNRLLVHRAIDALRLVSDEHQSRLIHLHLLTIYDQLTIGRVLALGRTIDTIERVLSELHALLDQPPGVGSSEPPRLVPRPVRPVDGLAQPGLAVPSPGDGGPAAA
jgi:hypothetical protein